MAVASTGLRAHRVATRNGVGASLQQRLGGQDSSPTCSSLAIAFACTHTGHHASFGIGVHQSTACSSAPGQPTRNGNGVLTNNAMTRLK